MNNEEISLIDNKEIQYLFGKDIDIDINTFINILDIDVESQR